LPQLICYSSPTTAYSAQDKRINELRKKIKKLERKKEKYENAKRIFEAGEYYNIPLIGFISKDDYKNKIGKLIVNNKIKISEGPLKILEAEKYTKEAYKELSFRIRENDWNISYYKKKLASLEKERSKRFQKGHGYIEVKINSEKFSRPSKNLVRWKWQFRFDEINGVGVTLTKCWVRGYRGKEQRMNKRKSLNIRIEKYGSKFIDTPFMQYGIKHDKKSPGTMIFVYTGNDDYGNKVKAELRITRHPHVFF